MPQDEQLEELQEEQLEELVLLELPDLEDPLLRRFKYFPCPKRDMRRWVFALLHLGQEVSPSSFIPMVSTSNSFPHASHLYSYIGIL